MAIDTAERRFSMINWGGGGLLPVPDGANMDSDDERQMMLGAYSGLGFGAPGTSSGKGGGGFEMNHTFRL